MRVKYILTLSLVLMLGGILFAQDISTKSNTYSVEETQEDIHLLTDVWGGVKCYDDKGNNIYPLNYYTPSHCSPGCVAISLSQVLNYYKWPKTGTGNNVYKDSYKPSSGGTAYDVRHSAFFDNVEYDYNNMLDEYKGKPSTDVQQEAVGELVYHACTALQMDFNYSGSTSNVNKVPFVAKNFFRFSGHYEYPDKYPEFWTKMKENIKAGNPVQTAVYATRTGAGHAFVVDGYRESDGYYHINWGTFNDWNVKNGWYDIENWTSESPGYNEITGSMFDMYPIPEINKIKKTEGTTDFEVSWITSSMITNDEFTLEQKVDDGEWEELSITSDKSYSVYAPTGKIYQFRVKAKTNGSYYSDSWSEVIIHSVSGGFNGFVSNGGSQKSYARQTPGDHLNFTSEYTFETWIRLDATSNSNDVILDQNNVFALEVKDVTSTTYSIEFTANSNSKLSTQNSGKSLAINEWIHIAISHSSSKTKMFVNGELYDSSNNTGFNLPHSDDALNIAERYHGGYSGQIVADLDQVRISKVARYNNNFTPTQTEHFDVDSNTITYLTFQNVHGVRYKDLASNLSFILLNNSSSIDWNYEETENELANEDLELVASLITVYPNPVTNNFIEISIEDNKLIKSGNIKFNLFDINGKVIGLNYTTEVSSNKWRINTSNIKGGVYFIEIDGGNFRMNRKIIIE